MAVRPTEISDIIRQQIAGFDDTTSLTNVGTVVSIGDGIANVYGLSNVMASELVEFPRTGTTGLAFNLAEGWVRDVSADVALEIDCRIHRNSLDVCRNVTRFVERQLELVRSCKNPISTTLPFAFRLR